MYINPATTKVSSPRVDSTFSQITLSTYLRARACSEVTAVTRQFCDPADWPVANGGSAADALTARVAVEPRFFLVDEDGAIRRIKLRDAC